ncbi:MAG: lipoate--protein ligase family protein [Ignavibacteriae bacterium]|nr:lipoate--protein ligase family protein [Ignavibacteriota bacterium]
MKLVDCTFVSPEENLACDEALLELVEDHDEDEILRFWESEQYFVVLGSSNRIADEVFVDRCAADGIPILRRHSGGGTVLQGPGCLNYALILRIDVSGPTRNITETTRYVMSKHAHVISTLIGEQVEINGSSDLTLAGRKFSGNAQRRRLNALLFHGTFLLNAHLELIERYLKLPSKQPAYRARRTHGQFVRNVPLRPPLLKQELAGIWNASGKVNQFPYVRMTELIRVKYCLPEWTFRL